MYVCMYVADPFRSFYPTKTGRT